MFGRYFRAALIFAGAAVVDIVLDDFADELLDVADCSASNTPVSTSMCTYGQLTADWFLAMVAVSLLIYLLFRAWTENQATGL